ncbi:Uncharacterised protein [Mycobacterium tuberculosis]|uniref:Uncharacterized protein n=1 Tax=Mycobacterium tuberculosis TaxID=1773 RepID=A0A655FHQ6_MYCTX|nr:Uncharacterised protein [Mycobacterium tuberculosis]CKP96874.1 Uncharacterised protein [Mycobacterium tuberculosis]CKT14458.1 Uncharacterised protein [Mycobacterium tuberculosis]CNM43694.1 Uncharacterised protein [Mycobacterium tuberculosis]CNM54221.1 Uncharacterised protein [Mycobacterium tuberculosis]
MNHARGKIGRQRNQPGVQEKDARDRVGGREDIQRVFGEVVDAVVLERVIDGGVGVGGRRAGQCETQLRYGEAKTRKNATVGPVGIAGQRKGQFVETRTQVCWQGLQIAHFEGGYRGALGGAEDDDFVSRRELRHDRGVQIRYALGHGDVIGQAIQPGEWEKLRWRFQERSGVSGMHGGDEPRSVLE